MHFLRVFSTAGIQKEIVSVGHPVVTMAGYENLLAIVYHGGSSFMGSQCLRLRVMTVGTRDCRVLMDTDCAITPCSELKWFGFSEEGQLFSFDTDGILRSFSFTSQTWSTRIDLRERLYEQSSHIWIVGISDQELLYIEVGQN